MVAVLQHLEIPAKRISEAGSPGADVRLGSGHLVEVKRRANTDGFSLPDKLLRDNGIVALRADRGEWVISMRPEVFADIYLGWNE